MPQQALSAALLTSSTGGTARSQTWISKMWPRDRGPGLRSRWPAGSCQGLAMTGRWEGVKPVSLASGMDSVCLRGACSAAAKACVYACTRR